MTRDIFFWDTESFKQNFKRLLSEKENCKYDPMFKRIFSVTSVIFVIGPKTVV